MHIREFVHRSLRHHHMTVLHLAAVFVLILMLHLLFVHHHYLIVFIQIVITTFSHLVLIHSWLCAVEMFIQLCLIHFELILFCLFHHPQFAIT